jgi:putative colanic acid biosynthesis acetyltransferase WcaF
VTRVIDLSQAGKGNYTPGRSTPIVLLWLIIETCIINNRLNPSSAIRTWLLRLFGAKIGRNCRFLHAIKVKYPWNLQVGDNSWFGEDVWLYNQAPLTIGSNVCISQGSFIATGSHDTVETMDLHVKPIIIEDGAWLSSRCIVQMGVTIGKSAVVTPNSVVHKSLEAGKIYGGNPCKYIRNRFPEDLDSSR